MNSAVTCFIATQAALYKSTSDKNGIEGCLTLILTNFAIVCYLLDLLLFQIIPNSCATHALLHIALNCENVSLGDTLSNFKQATLEMTPKVCALTIFSTCGDEA